MSCKVKSVSYNYQKNRREKNRKYQNAQKIISTILNTHYTGLWFLKCIFLQSCSALLSEGKNASGVLIVVAPSLPLDKRFAIQYICVVYCHELARVWTHDWSTAFIEPSCGILVSEWRLNRESLCIYTSSVAKEKSEVIPGLWPPVSLPSVPTSSHCATYFERLSWVRERPQCPRSPNTGLGAKQPLLSALSSPPKAFQADLQLMKLGLFEVASECPRNCHSTSGGASAARASYRVYVPFLWCL